MGKVEKLDVGDKGFSLGCYLRIRITMDISQPLSRERLVRIGGPDSRWVEFKYERLPVFCYLCGKIDHDEKDCTEWIRSADSINSKEKQYGLWLRAVLDRLRNLMLCFCSELGREKALGRWQRSRRNESSNLGRKRQSLSCAFRFIKHRRQTMRGLTWNV